MIQIKTKSQIELIKKSCEILAEVKQILFDEIKEGITTLELDKIAFNEIKKRGAKPAFLGYHGFPGTACISINEEAIHGIPSNRTIKNGDIVKIDMGVIYKGYYSDSAFTKGVGNISSRDQKMIEVAKGSFYAGLDAIKPGARVGDISFAINKYATEHGFEVCEEYSGHGIGKKLHEDPLVPNNGLKGVGPLLSDGMVICIEPIILQDTKKIKTGSDNWTIIAENGKNTAHYEHTILIENGRGVILTEGI